MVPQFLTLYASLDCAAAALADEAGSKYSKGWALGVRNERLVATFENTVMIGRPIEEVFGFLADFENVPIRDAVAGNLQKLKELLEQWATPGRALIAAARSCS
jgi:uncharacterized membrane protein